MAFIYLHLHRISNSFFFPGNLSTFSFTEFKKHQGHTFSILNFVFFKPSVAAASPSRHPAFILSYLLLQTPAARAAPSQGHRLAPLHSCARNAWSREMLLGFSSPTLQQCFAPRDFSPSALSSRKGIPTGPHPFPVRVTPQSPQHDCHRTPPATLALTLHRPTAAAQQWIQVCLVSRWC